MAKKANDFYLFFYGFKHHKIIKSKMAVAVESILEILGLRASNF